MLFRRSHTSLLPCGPPTIFTSHVSCLFLWASFSPDGGLVKCNGHDKYGTKHHRATSNPVTTRRAAPPSPRAAQSNPMQSNPRVFSPHGRRKATPLLFRDTRTVTYLLNIHFMCVDGGGARVGDKPIIFHFFFSFFHPCLCPVGSLTAFPPPISSPPIPSRSSGDAIGEEYSDHWDGMGWDGMARLDLT